MHRLAVLVLLVAVALVPSTTAGGASPLGYVVVLESGASPDAVAADHARRFGVDVRFV